MKNFLILNGPNLNLLGIRNVAIYGSASMQDLQDYLIEYSLKIGVNLDFYQSNHEGDLIDCLHDSINKYCGIVFNPAAYSHYSYALRDAVESINIPVAEVHLSNIKNREEFRAKSVIAPVCVDQICGYGFDSYTKALDLLAKMTD